MSVDSSAWLGSLGYSALVLNADHVYLYGAGRSTYFHGDIAGAVFAIYKWRSAVAVDDSNSKSSIVVVSAYFYGVWWSQSDITSVNSVSVWIGGYVFSEHVKPCDELLCDSCVGVLDFDEESDAGRSGQCYGVTFAGVVEGRRRGRVLDRG